MIPVFRSLMGSLVPAGRRAGRTRLACAGMSALIAAGCVPPRAIREIERPREGAALNDRVCIVFSQHYQISLGGMEKLHPFDINKYARIYLRLVEDGLLRPEDVFVPEPISRDDLLRVHTPAYLERLRQPARLAEYLELPVAALLPSGVIDAGILQPFRYATGGTLLAARLAMQHEIAINLGGGYHHAEPGRGGGFCIYADMPVAIRTLQAEGRIRRALVVDLDVHQGNGTDICLQGDETVFTFDMHEEDIYPVPKAASTLDVPLPADMGDQSYLALLAKHLPDVFDRARPDIVFLQAGVDVLEGDPLAHLWLTCDGIVRRDGMVFAEASRRKVPIVMVLGGGYSKDAWLVQYRSIAAVIRCYGSVGGPTTSDAK